MNEQERRKIITYVVEDVYVPQLNIAFTIFLNKYHNQYKQSEILSKQVGMPVKMSPVVFDYRHLNKQLIEHLVKLDIVYNKSNE